MPITLLKDISISHHRVQEMAKPSVNQIKLS